MVSPKPGIPPPQAYDPPSPPSSRELGPPPPGYGRYADFDRGFGNGTMPPGGTFNGPPGSLRRNLDEVLCFKVSPTLLLDKGDNRPLVKCGEKGHYANHCRNRNVPGNRGGNERVKRYGGSDD